MPNLPRIYAVSERQDRENRKPQGGRKPMKAFLGNGTDLIEKIENPKGDGNILKTS